MEKFYYYLKIAAILFVTVIVAACATTADEAPDPTVSIRTIGPANISPGASPGEQDAYTAQVAMAFDPGVEINEFGVYVTDSNGDEVYSLVLQEPIPADTIPDRFNWAGIRNSGAYVDDGTYFIRVEVIDSVEQRGESNREVIIVDNTEPRVQVRTQYNIFSPDGDGNRDTIVLEHQVVDVSRQVGEIFDGDDEVVRRWEWADTQPEPLSWDGRDSSGELVPDGTYRYVYTAHDAAGNSATATLDNLRVSSEAFAATLERAIPAFSPDGDGVRDAAAFRVSLQDPEQVSQWTFSVRGPDGSVVAERTGSNAPAERATFDGLSNGNPLPQGEYTASLTATYANGDVVTVNAEPVTLDLDAPTIQVSADASLFSPSVADGTLRVVHDASGGTFWEGAVIRADEEEPILGIEWDTELPDTFTWNGQTNAGEPAAGGEYVYQLTGRDRAGNETAAMTASFTLDRNGPDVSVEVSPRPFTPDGDGTNDQLEIAINTSDRTGIASWSLTIMGPTGSEFLTREGEGAPPQPIRWDGTGSDGSDVQSAREYSAVVSVTDRSGNTSSTERTVPIGILVNREPDGDMRVRLTGIRFAPFEAEYRDLRDPAIEQSNQQTLDRMAEILAQYPDREVQIEGHAVHLYEDEQRREIEQQETLLPLSSDRAAAVRDALVERGISEDRLTVVGRGGSEPLVPHTDEEDRWRNRRVEFELIES